MYRVIFFKTSSGREVVMDFIDSFSNAVADKVRFDIRLLKEYGLSLLSTSKVKKMFGFPNLYELRIKASVQIRLFFVYIPADMFIILHGFVKKTNKTPKKELDIANYRRREFDI